MNVINIAHIAVFSSKESIRKWQKEFSSEVFGMKVDVQPCQQSDFAREFFIATITFSAPPEFEYWDDLKSSGY